MKPIVNQDPHMKVYTDAYTPRPQALVYVRAKQDYSSEPLLMHNFLKSERHYGEQVIEMLLAGDRGHFGCLEHPQINLACHYVPHSVMQQARTHRLMTFDCQSFRYTGAHLMKVGGYDDLEKVIYFRPAGEYTARDGKRYHYTEEDRMYDRYTAMQLVKNYLVRFRDRGMAEEHLRGMLPFDYRQHFGMSFNLRSGMHFLDLRLKPDAQLEMQWFAQGIYDCLCEWCPQLMAWYTEKRYGKGRLAP